MPGPAQGGRTALRSRRRRAHRRAARPSAAARSAVRLGIVEFELGNADAGRAWLARAEELLGADGPPEVEAYLLWIKARFVGLSTATSTRRSRFPAARWSSRRLAGSTSLRALVIAYEGFYRMTLGDVATGRARQDQAAAAGLSSEVDPLTGSLIYCSILWTCRTFADWSRAAQWSPGFELWCKVAYAEVTGSCRLHSADVLASVGRLADALREIDLSIRLLIEEGTWELGDAYRVRGDILAMMGEPEAARADYQLAISLGWDAEPGLAQLRAEAGDVAQRARRARPLAGAASWYGRQRRAGCSPTRPRSRPAPACSRRPSAAGGARRLARRQLHPRVQAMAIEARAELEACAAFSRRDRRAPARPPALDRHPPRLSRRRLQLRLADLMDRPATPRAPDRTRRRPPGRGADRSGRPPCGRAARFPAA